MESVQLKHTDLRVSRLCMGTMTFGSQVGASQAKWMVDRCLDEGINFFDTANVYNQGKSEEILGQALGGKRPQVILASKVRGEMQEDPRTYSGLSPTSIRTAVADTLQRLRTDYLDIYYLHQPDYDAPIEETLEVMEQLRREGKIRYTATSNYSAWQICEMLWICRQNGYEPPWISQPMYNLTARGIEQEYFSFTRRFGISNVCYNPLAGGLLSGKQVKEKGPLPGTRFDANQMYLGRYWHEEYFAAIDALKQVADRAGVTLVQLAITWLLQNPDVHSILLGASRPEQLEENLKAATTPPLDAASLEACDGVWSQLRGPTPKYNR